MIFCGFYGYSLAAKSLRQAQMILAQARREKDSGDIDAWFRAGCPVGRGYQKWGTKPVSPALTRRRK